MSKTSTYLIVSLYAAAGFVAGAFLTQWLWGFFGPWRVHNADDIQRQSVLLIAVVWAGMGAWIAYRQHSN
jgi:hypothetical protein